jgi:allophanate hydrolase subunit 2
LADFCSNKFDLSLKKAQNSFFNKEFSVTKLADRMGIRLKGHKLENIVSTNIKSEGLIRGAIQVPADGNPIIMLSDHGTIGGYPKIGSVITTDLPKLGQCCPGSIIQFKECDVLTARQEWLLRQMRMSTFSQNQQSRNDNNE